MSFKGVCKEPSAKITIPLFLDFDILKRATIHTYFGSCQFPWSQTCGSFANSSYFLVTLKLMASKRCMKILIQKLLDILRITQLYAINFRISTKNCDNVCHIYVTANFDESCLTLKISRDQNMVDWGLGRPYSWDFLVIYYYYFPLFERASRTFCQHLTSYLE